MKRRILLVTIAAATLMTTMPAWAGSDFVDYETGMIKTALDEGKTVMVDYSVTWCGTCRVQERVISSLLIENPKYQQVMKFVRVDWDLYGDKPVSVERNIPRRSTLLVLRGEEELGRIVADTNPDAIKKLLDAGL